MEKLKMHSPDLVAENIAKLAELFPSCVTEMRDEQGKVTRGIDFDQLRQELAGQVVEGARERYHLDWPGKREAILAANAPIAKTLRPCREESVDFDTTKNLFIEGDNLDALKLLQETYLGKVKLIYIDPPYNTGRDFIYDDDFAQGSREYLRQSSQTDETGNRMFANTEANGRFHSDWLTMMFPRLKLARNLLCEAGAIFVSIDDNEVHNLRSVMDEIFGCQNFVATFVWQKRISPDNDEKHATSTHDYVVRYMRSKWTSGLKGFERTAEQDDRYANPDQDPRGVWTSSDLTRREYREHDFYEVELPSGRKVTPAAGRSWSIPPARFSQLRADNRIWFGPNGDAMPRLKRFLTDVADRVVPVTWLPKELASDNQAGKKEFKALFPEEVDIFENPKPARLIETLIEMTAAPGDLVLDFFAGTGTTGHSVYKANATRSLCLKFILIQLPQSVQSGKFASIAEITKERLRRAGREVFSDTRLIKSDLDSGFRVIKVDTSNMQDVFYTPDESKQGDLLAHVDNIKPDRTPEDLLFQVLVDWGVDLALPITQEVMNGKTVFFVDSNALAACFDSEVNDDLVKEIAKRQPLRAVFRDSSFGSDSVKINVEQIFKLLSPATEVRSL